MQTVPDSEHGEFGTPLFPCVNCESPIPWSRNKKIYCKDFCKEEAKGVRWFRSCHSRGIQNNPDVRRAMKTRLAHLNTGGYISLGRRIPEKTREVVYHKYQGMCAICGITAIMGEIDHISGSDNDISNLQYLCKACHQNKTQSNIKRVQHDDPRAKEIDDYNKAFFQRVFSKNPKNCDNHETWTAQEKELRSHRKIEYFKSLAPILSPMVESGMNNKAIRHSLNEMEIPTISGYCRWSKDSTRELIQSFLTNQ